ncbi:MAG: riboflavin biosynthesis protein RibD, partial [Daejeonella sp.]
LWDEARVFTGPQKWKSGILSPYIVGKPHQTCNIGSDILNIWRNNYD